MPVNPLDKSTSWPDKPFGLSNYQYRPSETRTQTSEHRSSDGRPQLERAIWLARDLFREQVEEALVNNEYSPDAIFGLLEILTAVISNRDRESALKKLESNRTRLLWALRLYDKVPVEYRQKSPHSHTSLTSPTLTGKDVGKRLEREGCKFTDAAFYNWQMASRMLRLVAYYLDEITRKN